MLLKKLLPSLSVLLLAACGGSGGGSSSAGGGEPAGARFTRPELAQCMIDHRYREVGAGRDAPGRLGFDVEPGQVSGSCAGNTEFRFGSGIHDITGVVGYTSGAGWVNPEQVFKGLHTRQHARAFAIESPCNGKRVMFVSSDLGLNTGSITQGVLDRIAGDPELSGFYDANNVMLSATHTHQGPTGYSHYEAVNALTLGYDEQVLDIIVAGIYQAIRQAHTNIQAHPETAAIGMSIGELLNANINRSLPAFEMNNEAERQAFLNERGEQVTVNKRVVQLDLVRNSGSAVGIINWFGVHPTILGPELSLVGSDHKGFASLGFEKIMATDYADHSGKDVFVAAFAQADEGDSSPNIDIVEKPWPDPARGGGVDPYESNAIAGTKNLAKALEMYGRGEPLSGPVDFRLFHVKMDQVEVTDPVILDSLQHPAELDSESKRTCSGALGLSMGAGAEDGPGPSREGVSCNDSPDLQAAVLQDIERVMGATLPVDFLGQAVLCNVGALPAIPGVADYSCHAEKPILFPIGAPFNLQPATLPFQLFRLGNLAILGLPWEVTTMSARRLRKTVLDELAPAGVDTVIVAGLTNDFIHYLTTREEYAAQQYEGGSSVFGPWQLAAVQQESRKLAITMRDGVAAPEGPDYVDGTPITRRLPYIASDLPGFDGTAYGELIRDVTPQAQPGETVRAEWQSGHPRNDVKVESGYVYVERKTADGEWEVYATDLDPALWYVWKPLNPNPLPIDPVLTGPSTAEAVWHIPLNTPTGIYRLRHDGAAGVALLGVNAFSSTSGEIAVYASGEVCPY